MQFNFSKTFDSVRHDVVLEQLCTASCGDAAMFWLRSCLTDRRHAVLGKDVPASAWLATTTVCLRTAYLGLCCF